VIEPNDDAPTQRVHADHAAARGSFVSGLKVFSRYTLEAQVGRGGMGVVWRAHDEKLDRPVALKFLPPEVAADAEAVRDLKLETRRCLDLTHVNIVRVYDFVEEGTDAAIAMEYVEGESLAKIKAAAPGGCLAAADLTPFVAQLCGALRYAHDVAKIAHHDLKPANVLVTSGGVLKITDFGIARITDSSKTKTGMVLGTPSYMSPEQLSGKKVDGRSDLFSLAVSLYQMLCGALPFVGDSMAQLMFKIANEQPTDILSVRPDLPPGLVTFLNQAMAKEAEARYQTGDEFAAALRAAFGAGAAAAATGGVDMDISL